MSVAVPLLAVMLQATPMSQATAPSPSPTVAIVPVALLDFLEGHWRGRGQFIRNNAPLESTYIFRRVLDGQALAVEHLEAVPNTFAFQGVLTVDTIVGGLALLIASNKGGGGRLMRSPGWEGETLTFTADPALRTAFARERIIIRRTGSDAFHATYQMSRDDGQTWRTGDEQNFVRVSAP